MSRLAEIKQPIKDELTDFESYFRATVKSDIKLLNFVLNYMLRTKGKQIRPLFVFLSAKMCGNINQSTFNAATAIELLHTATLVHDDVVDVSYERRGKFSINALWKNKIAVLLGDYLLSKGLLISTKYKEYEMLDIISTAVEETSEGELLQNEKSRKLDINEETYFKIITQKTASFIGASMEIGAFSVSKDRKFSAAFKEVGILAGIAFQIRDDIFDYEKKNIIGKPTGNDIKERKITLPLIYVLNNMSAKDRKKIIRDIKKRNDRPEKVQEIIKIVRDQGGIDYAKNKMEEYINQAINKLKSIQTEESSEYIEKLILFSVKRDK